MHLRVGPPQQLRELHEESLHQTAGCAVSAGLGQGLGGKSRRGQGGQGSWAEGWGGWHEKRHMEVGLVGWGDNMGGLDR